VAPDRVHLGALTVWNRGGRATLWVVLNQPETEDPMPDRAGGLLLTGASGFVGQSVLARWLARSTRRAPRRTSARAGSA
jgi:hypothetical protein